MVKRFGDFEFDDRRRHLTAGAQRVRLTGQAVDLLCLLLERPGELITREEIERRLWPDCAVDLDHSLDVVLSRLRTVLGDKGASPRYIQTVPRKGYRFIEPEEPLESSTDHLHSRRGSRSDCGNPLCAHALRDVCSARPFAGVTSGAGAVIGASPLLPAGRFPCASTRPVRGGVGQVDAGRCAQRKERI